MKPIIKQTNKKAAFTIVELLVVMSIIIILIGLILPSLNIVRRYARRVAQKAQFHSIEIAMDLFNNEFDGYPDSDAKDKNGDDYCGAMKLCEAMMGQDLLGFHPDSHFRSDGWGGSNKDLYDDTAWTDAEWIENLKSRRGPYLQLENANAYRMKNLYGAGNTGPLDEDRFVLCDMYKCVTLQTTGPDDKDISGKTGMPILYYKANTAGTKHPTKDNSVGIDDPANIYNYKDNDELVLRGMPWAGGATHPMASTGTTPSGQSADPRKFYDNTQNKKITIKMGRPYRSDSYILLSAGFDGEYGTRDDVFNFRN